MQLSTKKQKGFTLIEILIVISIIAILSMMGLSSFGNSTELIKFKGFTNQVAALFREARSLALTGEAIPDYTDYDEDKVFYPETGSCSTGIDQKITCPNSTADDCYCDVNEKVLAAGYGIYFSQDLIATKSSKVVFFTNLHNKSEDYFDDGQSGYKNFKDQTNAAKSLDLATDVNFKQYNLLVNSTTFHGTIIYTTPNGDLTFNGIKSKDLLVWLYNKDKGCMINGEAQGDVIVVNKVAGIPEIIQAATLTSTLQNTFSNEIGILGCSK